MPTEVGFYYGTSSNPTSGKVVNSTASSFSLDLTGLKANTKYYYCAYVKVSGTGDYADQSEIFKDGIVKNPPLAIKTWLLWNKFKTICETNQPEFSVKLPLMNL